MNPVNNTPVMPAVNVPVVWSIREVVSWSAEFLQRRGSDSPRLDAELLLAHALRCQRLQLYLDIDKPLQVAEREIFKALLKRRGDGEPVAYILGEREFWGRSFAVDQRVLIPRPDTELLIELIHKDFAALPDVEQGRQSVGGPRRPSAWGNRGLSILDIGTGSGCIATTLACELPEARLTAWDVSADALAVAVVNAQRHQVSERIEFAQRDVLQIDAVFAETFDVVVSNPPYIAEVASHLDAAVQKYEPHLALFAGVDGLRFYQHLALHADAWLRESGRIYLEIGFDQGQAVLQLFAAAGWDDLRIHPDLQGRDRVLSGCKHVRN